MRCSRCFIEYDNGELIAPEGMDIDEAVYDSMLMAMPTSINWETMTENTDNVEGAQMLACVAGICEI